MIKYFLIVLFAVGVTSAFAEQGPNYDKDISFDEYGNEIFTNSLFAYDRISDGATYRDYVFSDLGDTLEIKTAGKTVHLDKTTCGYSVYDSQNVILFGDSIVGFQSVVDMYSWNAVTQVNSAACEAYYDQGNDALVAKKYASGVGYMEYKYFFNLSVIKTQLEVTNLSGLTDRVFGFDQTIDLYRDTIMFGGVERNLDNFHGQTFTREFLENNQADVLELLNGINYDFDIGFEYLDSISVIDTGVNSSKLVFHFMRNNEILMPNETLIIDPTFSETSTVLGRVFGNPGVITTSCAPGSYAGFVKDATVRAFMGDSDLASQCGWIYASFNSSSIPDTATFQSAILEVDVTATAGTVDEACDVVLADPTMNYATETAANIYAEIYGETREIVSGNTFCQSTGTGKQISITLTDSEIREDRINLGFDFVDNTRSSTDAFSYDLANIELQITYTLNQPTEFDVSINTDVIGDTAKINGTVTLTQAFPLPVNLDSIQILRNGSQVNLNGTNSTFTAVGQTVNFGDIWNRMTTADTFNFTAVATVDNATASQITNSSQSLTSREYDPSYSPAIDNPATQGSVNATVSRFDSEDGILLKVNRIDVSSGDEWQIECIAQTNSEAAASKNTTAAQSGTWYNVTDTGYLNATFTGFLNSHAYITCYNDDLLFTLTDFTDSSLALLGIALFDESYGSMIGVPVGIFFLVMTAGMANKRTAPTFIILITGIAGTMATIGFFSFEPLVWGLALVTAMLGIFVNQKIF